MKVNKERCIVYLLAKNYKSARDQANSFQANSEYSPVFKKEAIPMLRAAEYEAWNAFESAKRILYDIPL